VTAHDPNVAWFEGLLVIAAITVGGFIAYYLPRCAGDGIRKMVLFGYVLSGLVIFVWPILSFLAVFLGDAPSRSRLMQLATGVTMLSIFVYPATWGLSLWFTLRALKGTGSRRAVIMGTAMPFLSILGTVLGFLACYLLGKYGE
jgi:hypothetical protein